MLDDAALALEEIEHEDKTRTEVLGARVALYITAKKWDMAAAIASHLVKVDPGTAGRWISLAYSVRRTEGVEKAEAILLRAQAIHPKVAMIAFYVACYASVTGPMEEAKERLRRAIDLDKDVRKLAIDDEDLKPLWEATLSPRLMRMESFFPPDFNHRPNSASRRFGLGHSRSCCRRF